jgi:Haem-binding domain
MNKKLKRFFFIGFILFLLMQLYQPARNSDNGQVLSTHITKLYNLPDSVNFILKTACYDCHSNNTNYPRYAYIQPARLFMENHIRDAKKELNFSEFGNYSTRKQQSKLEEISKQVKSGDMPLSSYTWLHKSARLTAKQKEIIINWAADILKSIE